MKTDELATLIERLWNHDMDRSEVPEKNSISLRQQVSDGLREIAQDEFTRMIRDMFMSENAIRDGWGADDARNVMDWLDDQATWKELNQ